MVATSPISCRHEGRARSFAAFAGRGLNRSGAARSVGTALVALVALVAASLAPAVVQARDTAQPTSELLEELNTDFRALYKQRTQQVLEELPLVLVVQNNSITAVRGTQRRIYAVPLQRYNEARAIIHTVLAFHGVASNLAHAEGDSPVYWAQLQAFAGDLQRVRGAVGATTLSRAEQAQVLKVLEVLGDASREALATRSVSPQWLADTLARTRAPLASLTESVGQAHASAMKKELQRVQSDATAEEWEHVVAVVTGPMTPRRNNLETAVVASVVGKEHLGTRIFYSENIFSVDGALSYLQTLVGDRELSQNVFGEPYRMWEDLFAPISGTLVEAGFYTGLGGD